MNLRLLKVSQKTQVKQLAQKGILHALSLRLIGSMQVIYTMAWITGQPLLASKSQISLQIICSGLEHQLQIFLVL